MSRVFHLSFCELSVVAVWTAVVKYDFNVVVIELSHLFSGNLVGVSGLYQPGKLLQGCDVTVMFQKLCFFLRWASLYIRAHKEQSK